MWSGGSSGQNDAYPLTPFFWGARYGKLVDPYGHEWGINQQLTPPTQLELDEAAKRYLAKKG